MFRRYWNKIFENIGMWLVFRSPAILIYWAGIRIGVTVTKDDEHPGDISLVEALKRFDKKERLFNAE